MDDSTPQGERWEDAVSEASHHVESRHAAEAEAAERQKPRAEGPKLAVALVILAVVLAWNFRALTQPIEPPPIEDEVEHLAWFVVDAVEAVEDFREDEGRLPTSQEASELLEDDVSYQPRGPDTYAIVIDDEGTRLEYDGSIPVDEWLDIQVGPGGNS